jgi:hypothetical protein
MIIFYATERFILRSTNKHDILCHEERFSAYENGQNAHVPTNEEGKMKEQMNRMHYILSPIAAICTNAMAAHVRLPRAQTNTPATQW